MPDLPQQSRGFPWHLSWVGGLMALSAVAGWWIGAGKADSQTIPRSADMPISEVATTDFPESQRAMTAHDTSDSSAPIVAVANPLPADDAESATDDPIRLAHLLRQGTEDERITVLTHGAELPVELLQQTIDTDTSERVRLTAFNLYLDSGIVSDPATLRGIMQAATENQSSAVRAEARRRLIAFEKLEESRALLTQQGTP